MSVISLEGTAALCFVIHCHQLYQCDGQMNFSVGSNSGILQQETRTNYVVILKRNDEKCVGFVTVICVSYVLPYMV